jgi:DNA-directed RNA polymerase specialized sigma subunit
VPKIKRRKQLKNRSNYIDNDKFLKEIISFKKTVKANGETRTPVPDALALYFCKLAKNLAQKGNFTNYTYKDDMIADGVENCIRYASNFDPSRSTNPFAYFTQIICFAFIRKIKKERKQLYIRYKTFMDSELSDNEEILTAMQNNDSLQENKREFIQNFEDSLDKKKVKKEKVLKNKKIADLFE